MVWLEILLAIIWAGLLYFSRGAGRKILLIAPGVVAVLEIWNQVFNGGAFYPEPVLLKFPGFDFPVAILLAGASFAYLVHRGGLVLEKKLDKKFYWLGVAVFTWFAILIEFIFTNLGFWQYTGWNDYSAARFFSQVPYLWVYGYHSVYTAGTILIGNLVESREEELKQG